MHRPQTFLHYDRPNIFFLSWIPLLLYVWVIHLKFLPHGALYFCCQRVLEKDERNLKRFCSCWDQGDVVMVTGELTIGNRPREWKRLGVLSGRVLFLKFFSSSWASWSISMHSAYLSCNSRNWIKDQEARQEEGKKRNMKYKQIFLQHRYVVLFSFAESIF